MSSRLISARERKQWQKLLIEHTLQSEMPPGWQTRLFGAVGYFAEVSLHLLILERGAMRKLMFGKKTIESRLYQRRDPVYDSIERDDLVLLKRSDGPVQAIAVVCHCQKMELSPGGIDEIRREYGERISEPDEYWHRKEHARYGALLWFDPIARISPVECYKRDRRSMVTLMHRALPSDRNQVCVSHGAKD
jgi:hypothetical protein